VVPSQPVRLSPNNWSSDARALFEKVIGTFTPEQARPIWQRWLQYQMQAADLVTLHKLDKRVAEIYPKGLCRSILPGRPYVSYSQ
jgi:hypothetical protein